MSADYDPAKDIEIRDGKLFFKDKQVATKIDLPGWALAAAIITALAAALSVLVSVAAYWEQIGENVGFLAKQKKSYVFTDRSCEVDVHEHLVGKRLTLERIPLPCKETHRIVEAGD